MTRTILFVCPHNGAKSVLAEAYFRRRADEAGLNFNVLTAGDDPYETVVPAVVERLKAEGADVSNHQPRHFTSDDLVQADLIVSMECDVASSLPQGKNIEFWNDVPLVSEDIEKAYSVIQHHVDQLIQRFQD